MNCLLLHLAPRRENPKPPRPLPSGPRGSRIAAWPLSLFAPGSCPGAPSCFCRIDGGFGDEVGRCWSLVAPEGVADFDDGFGRCWSLVAPDGVADLDDVADLEVSESRPSPRLFPPLPLPRPFPLFPRPRFAPLPCPCPCRPSSSLSSPNIRLRASSYAFCFSSSCLFPSRMRASASIWCLRIASCSSSLSSLRDRPAMLVVGSRAGVGRRERSFTCGLKPVARGTALLVSRKWNGSRLSLGRGLEHCARLRVCAETGGGRKGAEGAERTLIPTVFGWTPCGAPCARPCSGPGRAPAWAAPWRRGRPGPPSRRRPTRRGLSLPSS